MHLIDSKILFCYLLGIDLHQMGPFSTKSLSDLRGAPKGSQTKVYTLDI